MPVSSKKRKTVATEPEVQPKKKVKVTHDDVENKKNAKDKGKRRETDAEAEFQVIQASLVVSVPPAFADDPKKGVNEMLDSMIMRKPRHIPALRGVVLSHSNLVFLTSTAAINTDCPFLICRVQFDATVWSPRVGMKLVGKINLSSPDHVSLLLHRTFNVSIPRHHIPADDWEFEQGPSEDDPPEDASNEEVDEAADENAEERVTGRWVRKDSGQKLGAESRYLEFTVIGLAVANEMLSLVGSIQLDPFSSDHVPLTARTKPNLASDPARNKDSVSDVDDLETDSDEDE
ncbi:unnamed protein product [Mycena citricolor]|uniref:RPA43 OB domain-containing protein n=1 Tax=Mycena citricolor TaxID=2018698 RepID=A0AAD2Q6G0_9AGAR|nr:unnamed protein product [Mycena citricolor]